MADIDADELAREIRYARKLKDDGDFPFTLGEHVEPREVEAPDLAETDNEPPSPVERERRTGGR